MPLDETEELVIDLEQVLIAGALMIAELVQVEQDHCCRRQRPPLGLRVHDYLAHVMNRGVVRFGMFWHHQVGVVRFGTF
jgi:hypothetical protein